MGRFSGSWRAPLFSAYGAGCEMFPVQFPVLNALDGELERCVREIEPGTSSQYETMAQFDFLFCLNSI